MKALAIYCAVVAVNNALVWACVLVETMRPGLAGFGLLASFVVQTTAAVASVWCAYRGR